MAPPGRAIVFARLSTSIRTDPERGLLPTDRSAGIFSAYVPDQVISPRNVITVLSTSRFSGPVEGRPDIGTVMDFWQRLRLEKSAPASPAPPLSGCCPLSRSSAAAVALVEPRRLRFLPRPHHHQSLHSLKESNQHPARRSSGSFSIQSAQSGHSTTCISVHWCCCELAIQDRRGIFA